MPPLYFAIISATLIGQSWANSRGAPCSVLNKPDLSPSHGARPQKSPSPYRLVVFDQKQNLVNSTVTAKKPYKVIIDFDREYDSLKGFVIRAAFEQDNGVESTDAGEFIKVPRCTRYVKWCQQGKYLTHRRPGLCRQFIFRWVAPEAPGQRLFFQMTGVLDYKTFWANIKTPSFRIEGAATKATKPPTTTTVKTTKAVTTRRTTTRRPTQKWTPPPTTKPFPTTPSLPPITSPPYDPACEPDGPDCLQQLRRDLKREFCEIEGWKDYCPQICCYKVKGEPRPDFS